MAWACLDRVVRSCCPLYVVRHGGTGEGEAEVGVMGGHCWGKETDELEPGVSAGAVCSGHWALRGEWRARCLIAQLAMRAPLGSALHSAPMQMRVEAAAG